MEYIILAVVLGGAFWGYKKFQSKKDGRVKGSGRPPSGGINPDRNQF